MDTAAKANPFNAIEKRAKLFFDVGQHLVEKTEIGVFAIVMNHEAGDAVHDLFDLCHIPFAKAAERTRRIGEVKA
ncbi:hypothetical protein D3C80_2113140 [compost metagenome]